MNIPDEISLMSVFECEPHLLDEGIPFYYNQATYKFSNNNQELFTVDIAPSYGEIRVQVVLANTNELISVLDLKNVKTIEILSDKKDESKLMISSESSIIKLNFKPKYKIYINQCYE